MTAPFGESTSGRDGQSPRTLRRAELTREYEATAIQLFASRGFRDVTVAEVAVACGVTSRTLFRYFPTKEDMLLALPRRVTRILLDEIVALPPSDDPVAAVWELLVDMTLRYGAPFDEMRTWYAAAADVPEVITRMRGERATAIEETLTAVFANWMRVDPATDVRPRVLAAAVQASERSVLSYFLERGGQDDLVDLFRMTFAGLRGFAATLQ